MGSAGPWPGSRNKAIAPYDRCAIKPPYSEAPGAEAHPLRHIKGGLAGRIGVVHPERSEWRIPDQASTNGRTDGLRIGNLQRLRERGRRAGEAPQAAGIGKHAEAQPGLGRNPRQRRAELGRRSPVPGAAHVVLAGSFSYVAGPEPVHSKAADEIGAAEEAVQERNLLTTPSGHVAALGAEHPHGIAHDLVIVAEVLGRFQKLHIAAEPREVLPKIRADAAGRVFIIVERVV